jgi:hypothetical protein
MCDHASEGLAHELHITLQTLNAAWQRSILPELQQMVTQSRSTTTPLFQPSLRDWQASWKARQASPGEATPASPTRVKKFIAYKRRKQKMAEAAAQA